MGLLKKLTKPLSKFLDKIVPNEIKPALPYLSAFAPFMPGMQGIMGSTMLKRALMSGALNLGSQLAQEGSEGDFDPLSLAMASGIGALSAPGTPGKPISPGGQDLFRVQETPGAEQFFRDKAMGMDEGLLRSGTELLGKGSKYLTKASQTFQDNPFSKEGLKAALVPATTGTADLARITAEQALRDFENTPTEDPLGVTDDGRRMAIRAAMEAAGHIEEDILDALASLGLRQGGIVGLKHGGRIGMVSGGGLKGAWAAAKAMKNQVVKSLSRMTDDIEMQGSSDFATDTGSDFSLSVKAKTKKGKKVLDGLVEEGIVEFDNGMYYISDMNLDDATIGMGEGKLKASGMLEEGSDKFVRFDEGIGEGPMGSSYYGYDRVIENLKPKKADGGMMSVLPKGAEMDYRGGGVIPMGSKERADDVPARLSKNEFVMTADAVKAAGGGNVNKGAKRMYNLMHNLEARV
jgi:hypothetical protein